MELIFIHGTMTCSYQCLRLLFSTRLCLLKVRFKCFFLLAHALEELYTINTRWKDSNVIVSSPILEKLNYKAQGLLWISNSEEILSLEAPSVGYFDYTQDFPLVKLKSLYKAIIPEDQIKQARASDDDLLDYTMWLFSCS